MQLHLARVKIAAGFPAEAQTHLDLVTNTAYLDLKKRLTRSLGEHQNGLTNAAAVIATNPPAPEANITTPANNSIAIFTNSTDVSSNLLVTPPILREPKTP